MTSSPQSSLHHPFRETPPRVILSQHEYNRVLPILQESINAKVEVCGLLRGVILIEEDLILITRILIPPSSSITEQSSTFCELNQEYLISQLTNTEENDEFLGRWHLHFGLHTLSQTDLRGVHSFMDENILPTHNLHLELLFVHSPQQDTLPIIHTFLFTRNQNQTIDQLPTKPPLLLPHDTFKHFLPWYMKKNNLTEFIQSLKKNPISPYLQQTKIKYGSMLFSFKNNENLILLYLPPNYQPALLKTNKEWQSTEFFVLHQLSSLFNSSTSPSSFFLTITRKQHTITGIGTIQINNNRFRLTLHDLSINLPLKRIRVKAIQKDQIILELKSSFLKKYLVSISLN